MQNFPFKNTTLEIQNNNKFKNARKRFRLKIYLTVDRLWIRFNKEIDFIKGKNVFNRLWKFVTMIESIEIWWDNK